MRPWKELGAQFIKIHPPYTWTLHRAVADEARRQELPVVGHAMGLEEATKSVTQGFTTLEHHVRFYDDVHRLMAAAGTRLDPTLGAGGANRWLLRREPDRLGGEKLRAFLSEGWVRERVNGGGILRRLSGNRFRGRLMDRFASIKRGHELGVTLLAGTDAPTQANFEGVSLHWELEHFVETGLAPLEVLRIATQHAAEAVGAEDDLGTLEAGKLADIVVLDANPLDDIRNTQTIWRVIKGGWVFDPEELRPPAMSNGN
ncbi:MAG: amidohydrolase family protein [Gemmatimonadetes bacterium]|uniref:Amidohydrolase family protein n=1 Tax=Candidatus Kutchimonas denitrificans TaxID=3056748 RepID=A0AAE4ZC64_9BACT|nr:amidohydrolase family protein [Gemmatimonadota bacterium]NIR76416.1 amidohydrolase family protein [Candidatus Kutchimonas denitrificans]NIS03235.1 amidohydrolase family protein [Gemmatimonadota bacterium]NIT69096.1 amidohydrolase family protein [Gemmatimonadota bacterium]NIU54488.1 amidohydrolase family protein [Gemmatimonadota bacterium]